MSFVSIGDHESLYLNATGGELVFLETFLTIYSILAPFSMIYLLFVSFCSIIALRLHIRRKSSSVRVIVWILGSAFSAFLLQVIAWGNVIRDWTSHGPSCNLAPKFATAAYALSNIFCYLFLYERAKVVSTACEVKWVFLRTTKMLELLKWGTYISPVMVIVCFVQIGGEAVHIPQLGQESGSVCAYLLDVYIGIMFLVMDTTLSIGYLVVFVLPVLAIMRSANWGSGDDSSVKAIKQMIRTNLKASLAAVVSTFVMLLWVTIGYGQGEGGWTMVLWTWVYPLSAIDSTINIAMMTSISTIWIPKRMRTLVRNVKARAKAIKPLHGLRKASSELFEDEVLESKKRVARYAKIENDSSLELRVSFMSRSSLERLSKGNDGRDSHCEETSQVPDL